MNKISTPVEPSGLYRLDPLIRPLAEGRDKIVAELKIWKKQVAIVTGVTGAGKTSIIDAGFGTGREVVNLPTDKIEAVLGKIPDGSKYLFIDTPGDPSREAVLESGISQYITGEIVSGIINVVSCGYNVPADRQDEFVATEKKISAGRDDDCRYISTLLNMIDSSQSVKWFLTVANKSDLWDKDQNLVQDLYGFGSKYDTLIREKFPGLDPQMVVCSTKDEPEEMDQLSVKLNVLIGGGQN